jgi:septum formation protein
MTSPDLWKSDRKIILASTSTTRLKLLTSAGLPCRTIAPDADERIIADPLEASGVPPGEVALALARAKALSVSTQHSSELVLGADQTLALGARILHKPRSSEEAAGHLTAMSGNTHHLHTAVALARDGAIIFETVQIAQLTMRVLSAPFIATYLEAAGELVQQSVGAYQVEGLGIHLFERIEGDHSTILGLPLIPLLGYFRAQGWVTA